MIADFTYEGQVVKAHVVGRFRVFVCCGETNHAVAHEDGWLISCGFRSLEDAMYVADAVSLYSTQEGHEFKSKSAGSVGAPFDDLKALPFDDLKALAYRAFSTEALLDALDKLNQVEAVPTTMTGGELHLTMLKKRVDFWDFEKPLMPGFGSGLGSSYAAARAILNVQVPVNPRPKPAPTANTPAPSSSLSRELVSWARSYRFTRRWLDNDEWKPRAQRLTQADWDLFGAIMRDFGFHAR